MKRYAPLRIGLFVLLFLFTNLGTAGVYAAINLQVSNSNAKPGDTITITGTTAPGDWASLRAIDQNGSILYFNAVKADNNGQFTDTFKAPENCTGTLQVTAGQGNDSAAASVTITNAFPPTPPTPPPGGGGGGSPGGSGGSSSSPSTGNQSSKSSGDTSGLIDEKKPLPQPEPEFVPPADIAGHWAKDSIATATANGLINGYGHNAFGPDSPITREQAAVIISRAAKLGNTTEPLKYPDTNQISPWAQPGIAAAVKAGFINGYPDRSFKPKKNMTRAETAAIMVKLLP